MTDPDADALYRFIVRHPDDDTPRLAYADWLQENGRAEEGEFLRMQCRLTTIEPDDPEYPELLDRGEELRLWLSTHAPGPRLTFPAGLSVEGGTHWWKWTHRGFPRFLEFDGYERPGGAAMRALARALSRAFGVLPTRWLVVRFITIPQLAALLKQPVLAKLSELTVQLSVHGDEADEAAQLLANCRHLRNLRGLVLSWDVSNDGCTALVGGPWGKLEWLSSTGTAITPDGLSALVGAGWFRQLRSLGLSENLPADTFETLSRLATFPRLHTLNLSDNATFTQAGWDAFGATRSFPALTRLIVSDCDLSGGRFDALAGASGFSLAVLTARACATGPGTGAALAASPWASSLRVLDLGLNGLEPADVKALAECKKFGALRHLDLASGALNASALSALAASPALRELRALDLSGRPGDSRGLTPTHFDRFLAKLDMPDLRHLDLSGRPVGPKAARRFTDAKFASLTRLSLNGCKLTDPAVAALVAAPALRNLIQFDLRDNKLAAPDALADRSLLPRLASCTLSDNDLPAPAARKLRRRPGVRV